MLSLIAALLVRWLLSLRRPNHQACDSCDTHLDDFDPSEPGDPWNEYLKQPHAIENGRLFLEYCFNIHNTDNNQSRSTRPGLYP